MRGQGEEICTAYALTQRSSSIFFVHLVHCLGFWRGDIGYSGFVVDIAGVVRDRVGNFGDFAGGDVGGGLREPSKTVSSERSRAPVDFEVVRDE